MRRSRPVLALAAALAVVPLPAAAARNQNAVLDAIVGTNDGFDITLNDSSGAKVNRLDPGTYMVVVHDRSALHNFHLASNEDPTVDFRTDVEFVGDKTFTATFRPGLEYAYACEPHWQIMNGRFQVNVASSSPPPPPPSPPTRGRITATVAVGGKVALSRTSVVAGRYVVSVRDRSRRDNFHLAGRGVNRRTGRSFTGTATWNVSLSRGTYVYGSDRVPVKRRLRVR